MDFGSHADDAAADLDARVVVRDQRAGNADVFLAAEQAIKAAQQLGIQEVELFVKGPGPGRENAAGGAFHDHAS